MGDTFLGDDFFHNGAFRLGYGFEYSALSRLPQKISALSSIRFDVYDW